MKKTLCMLAVVMTIGANVSQAQIQRGNVLIGSELSNFRLSLNKGGAFEMRIDPKAAWFVRDNLALGGYLMLDLQTASGAGTFVSYGVGAMGRSYMNGDALHTLQHTRLFVEGNLGIEGENNSLSDNSSTNGLGFGIGPGLAYFITTNVGLEGLLKYNGIVGFGNNTYTSYLNLGVGFQIYLSGRAVQRAATNTQ